MTNFFKFIIFYRKSRNYIISTQFFCIIEVQQQFILITIKRVHSASREIVRAGLVESAHDLSDGGLAVAVAESSFGSSGIGASIKLASELPPHYLLFYEAPSRILISAAKDSLNDVLTIANSYKIESPVIGETVVGQVIFSVNGKDIIKRPLGELQKYWANALEGTLKV